MDQINAPYRDPETGERSSVKVSTPEGVKRIAADVLSESKAITEAVEEYLRLNPPKDRFIIWAEEAGGRNNNSQYSYGNGSTGNIGITLAHDCILYALTSQADSSTNNSDVSVEIMDFTSGSVALQSVNLANAGQANNYHSVVNLSDPIKLTKGTVIGFRTNVERGNTSDKRVAAWLEIID